MYRTRIYTGSFKPMTEASERASLTNALMKRLDGWMSLECNLMEVRWRICEFLGLAADGENSYAWKVWKNRPENTVTFRYKANGETMTRVFDITGAGSKNTTVSVDSLMNTLCTKKKIVLPFTLMYDGKGYISSHFTGCYMEISSTEGKENSMEQTAIQKISDSTKEKIRAEHKRLLKKLSDAELDYLAEKTSLEKRAVYEFIGGKYNELVDIAEMLGILLEDIESRYRRKGER